MWRKENSSSVYGSARESDVLDALSQIVSEKILKCPLMCILRLFPEGLNIKNKVITNCVLRAKHTSALFWKKPSQTEC